MLTNILPSIDSGAVQLVLSPFRAKVTLLGIIYYTLGSSRLYQNAGMPPVNMASRPHVCETCGKGFAQFSGLKTHWNVQYGIQNQLLLRRTNGES